MISPEIIERMRQCSCKKCQKLADELEEQVITLSFINPTEEEKEEKKRRK